MNYFLYDKCQEFSFGYYHNFRLLVGQIMQSETSPSFRGIIKTLLNALWFDRIHHSTRYTHSYKVDGCSTAGDTSGCYHHNYDLAMKKRLKALILILEIPHGGQSCQKTFSISTRCHGQLQENEDSAPGFCCLLADTKDL